MKEYTFTQINRECGSVLDDAMKQPVTLCKNGKPKIVMIPYEAYEEASNNQAAYKLGEEPPEVSALLDEGLDNILKDDD
ncbi:type II toxin-antitoxin system prevent-host-death family antitoxin [Pseudovibrio sp. Tun.PSC04-5.I4]|uniref:type II toxin-antitoxin system prevent-host-death family antitoxin n=1 Tax=Pseudovibrio sp. Tun.PSC04-5.I4 TaxID=1798213 RepID=UPI0008926574|nr:type II toxin-antitoxin system prevent-host-death family antitoxin [Pseudovibrio sp. Tun.PSC04-5.I4]SDR49158.1 prevent-host-death family protein [Pseudovibrio sp. Tun.PSC04-5.I4]